MAGKTNLCQFPECGANCKKLFCNKHKMRDPKRREKQRDEEFLDVISKGVSKTLADPEVKKRHSAATRAAMERPGYAAAHAAGMATRMPEELILDLYKKGWLLSEIAREVGTGNRPNSKREPRLSRVRTVLKRAGVHPASKAKAAKAGQ